VYQKSRKFSLFLQTQPDFALKSLGIHKGFLRLFALNPACVCEISVIFFVFRYTLVKMSSADAQREKKDVTGYTRSAITDALEKALPRLAETALKAQDIQNSLLPGEYHASCSFGEYGAPSFDSRVQTVAAAAGAGVMSVEAQVDELWGSSKDDAWKAAEVQRIRLEQGIADAAEPELDAPSGLMPGPDA
jgi:hypothetical protein